MRHYLSSLSNHSASTTSELKRRCSGERNMKLSTSLLVLFIRTCTAVASTYKNRLGSYPHQTSSTPNELTPIVEAIVPHKRLSASKMQASVES